MLLLLSLSSLLLFCYFVIHDNLTVSKQFNCESVGELKTPIGFIVILLELLEFTIKICPIYLFGGSKPNPVTITLTETMVLGSWSTFILELYGKIDIYRSYVLGKMCTRIIRNLV